MAKTPFHAAYTLLHDAVVKKGFITLSGEVSLPFRWDDNCDIISLKYKKNEKELDVKCLLMNESMVVNFLHNNELKTLDVPILDYVENFDETESTYDVKCVTTFERKVYDDLVYPLFSELKPASPAAPSAERPRAEPVPQQPRPDPLRDDRFQGRRGRPRVDPMDPFGVGAGDLDPFGGPGGGMIMDPMRNRGGFRPEWPPAPPGARYDPIGPGGRGPDHDDLLPPDRHRMFDEHDMFM